MRPPAALNSPDAGPRAAGGTVSYEVRVTYHEHGLETVHFVRVEAVNDTAKSVHTGYKRQEGTITDAFTDKITDPRKRREKLQMRTSGPPKYEDTSDKDSWVFARFVPVESITREFIESEVAALQEKLSKARTVMMGSAVPKEYKQAKIREAWCYPYVVRCTNEFAAHGTVKLEAWDTVLTNKDIVRLAIRPSSAFPEESAEAVAEAGGFFSPGSDYDLLSVSSGTGLPSITMD